MDEHGSPCWFELNARDFDAAVNFYVTVFGVGTKVMGDSDDFRYTTLVAGDHEVAGVLDASHRSPKDPVALGDLLAGRRHHEATQRASELGGQSWTAFRLSLRLIARWRTRRARLQLRVPRKAERLDI